MTIQTIEETLLRKLRVKQLEDLLAKLDSGEATAQDHSVIRALLKDNNIVCEIVPGTPKLPTEEDLPFIREGVKLLKTG